MYALLKHSTGILGAAAGTNCTPFRITLIFSLITCESNSCFSGKLREFTSFEMPGRPKEKSCSASQILEHEGGIFDVQHSHFFYFF